jgi:hypothetical protein
MSVFFQKLVVDLFLFIGIFHSKKKITAGVFARP